MNDSVIIIGASGHGKVVADIIEKSGDKVMGFLDDDIDLPEMFIGFPILGTVNEYIQYLEYKFIVAIGDAAIREHIFNALSNVRWYTAIHPACIIGKGVQIGIATVVAAGAVLNPYSKVGKGCIINTGSIVDHDCTVDDFAHISVGSHLAGMVYIGKRTWVGIGANIRNNIRICNDCIIGAGAAVVSNIEKSGIYVGVPASRLEHRIG